MRIKNNTQRFAVFVRDLQESFWGDFQGRTRETLQKLPETKLGPIRLRLSRTRLRSFLPTLPTLRTH